MLWLYRCELRWLEGAFCTSPGCTEHLGFCLYPSAVAEKPVFLKAEDGLMIRLSEWFGLFCIRMILEVAFEINDFQTFWNVIIELSPVLIRVPGLILDFN